MAEEVSFPIDPKELENRVSSLMKDAGGRRLLGNIQKAIEKKGGKKGKVGSAEEKIAEAAFKAGRESAAAAGGGAIKQFREGIKASREAEEQYQIATQGITKRRERILEMFGVKVGSAFRKTLEKQATPEQIAAAKKRFGLDKEQKKEDKSEKEGGEVGVGASGLRRKMRSSSGNDLKRPVILILRNVLEMREMVKTIQSSLTKPTLKRGVVFNEKAQRFQKVGGEGRGQFVKAATAYDKPVIDKRAQQAARTEALTKAIMADEDPLVKIGDTLDAVLKSLGEYKNQNIHDKVDELLRNSGSGGFGVPGFRMLRTAASLAAKGAGVVAKGAAALGRGAARVVGAAGTAVAGSKVGQAVASKVGTAAAKAAAVKTASKEAIKKVATKVIQSQTLKTAGKSIPLVGAAVGGYFAVKKLIEGDKVGAGLEAASGVGGPLTAIPAAVASAVRDVYQGVYGIFPEEDSQAAKRMGEIKTVVTEVATELIAGKKQDDKTSGAKGKPPSGSASTDVKVPKPKTVGSAAAAGAATAVSAAPGVTAPTAATPAPTGAPPAAPTGGAKAAPASSGPKFRLGPAAEGRGKTDASTAKNAALAAADKFGITGAHKAQFMAQLDHESGHFTRVEENLRYSAKRLMQIFPKYYKSEEDAKADEYQPMKIANRVYGGRMGNGPYESGDGYKYRGRGLIQLTGKDNYKKFSNIIGVDLVSNPDAAANLGTAADIAAAYYKKQVIDRGIDAMDTTRVTKAINGGTIGLADREAKFAEYLKNPKALGPGAAPPPEPAGAEAGKPTEPPSIPQGGAGGTAAADASAGGAATPQAAGAGAAPPPAAGAGAAQAAAPTAPGGGDLIQSIKSDTSQILTIVQNLQPVQGRAGGQVAAGSSEMVANQTAVSAPAAAAPVVVNNNSGGKATPPAPKTSLPKADTRSSENAFNRAIGRDFSHPSAFTNVVLQ